MDRREALSAVSMIVGGAIVGAGNFLSGCKPEKRNSIFGMLNQDEIKLVEEIAETILPKTPNSPGAKDVEVGKFMTTIVSDCYNAQEQQSFINGLLQLNGVCEAKYGDAFEDLTVDGKQEFVSQLEEESQMFNKNRQKGQPVHYYTMIKQLSIWGYLSSEKVGTQVLRHVPIPGRFDGCIPYQNGEKSYS